MIQDHLRSLVADAVRAAVPGADVPEDRIELDRPRQRTFGDFATNVALELGPRLARPPRDVAEAIVAHLPVSDLVRSVQVAGPGFINFRVAHGWLHDAVREILQRGSRYGHAEPIGRKVQVEFVSANPTGPLTIGHARNAAIGDALSRLLAAAGWEVEREYYFNDTGGQMDRFGASVEARYLQLLGQSAEVPKDGYHGSYVSDIAADILETEGPGPADLPPNERRERLLAAAVERVLDGIRRTLERFRVTFDSYLSERDLEERGEIQAAVTRLRDAGYAYEKDGAVWFRSTAFGDDKDRVVIRRNGRHTYFGADCAYLIDKFSRRFDHLIYVWGADHHGDVARVRGAAEALGYDPSAVEMLIYQFVAFLRGGEPVKMSKRAGSFISLDELIDEVGTDAARFHLLLFSNDHAMNFDIEEVKRQSLENPVYYVQYAHARIAGILRNAAGREAQEANLELLTHETETDLMRELAEVPEQIQIAAALRAPHRITHLVRRIAESFHRFYTECRVLSDDEALTQARLQLVRATKYVIANLLGILGVQAPETMERLSDA